MVKGAKALELWCARNTAGYPGVNVTNMTSAWRDGLAFCALIHRFRPDLVDFDKLDRRDIKGNCALAFRLGETHLGIPALLDPEDMAACVVPDRLSILTYVSEYYHKLSKMQPKSAPFSTSASSASNPVRRTVRRQDSTDSAGMDQRRSSDDAISRTTSSSETSSSSSSSSPPSEEGSSNSSSSSECGGDSPTLKEKKDVKKEEEAKVVLRRKRERSLASRRMVKSMFAESTGGISSLVNDDRSGSQSPEIERENPFRDVMMKFAGMEQRAKERKEEEDKKKRINHKATETVVTKVDSKSTQTFRSVLNTQLSCPAKSRSSRTTSNNAAEKGLSYTAKPRPYLAGQINRSLSMGQSLHTMASEPQQQQLNNIKKNDDYLMTQSFCGALPTAFSSVNITEQQQQHQQQQRQQQHPKRSSSSHARTPSIHKMPSSELSSLQSTYYQHQRPLIWHASPYSSSPSLHLQQQQQQQQQQQHLRQVNSGFFSFSPSGYQGTTLRHAPQTRRPLSVYNRPTTLPIEGQSSLV